MEAYARHLCALAKGKAYENAPLAAYTSWRIGGPADLLLEPAGEEELAAVITFCRGEAIPMLILGGGANLLCDDAGFRGVVIRMGDALGRLQLQNDLLVAGAGVQVSTLSRHAGKAGLSGLEHAGNIPGSLGGLVTMNGGSRRRSIGENVVSVTVLNQEGEQQRLLPDACGFGYRCSVFQRGGYIVTGAVLKLTPDEPAAVLQRIDADLRERQSKFPLEMPSCGSVFKSMEALYERFGPPGKVIEDAGLKGVRRGGVQVSPQHANFFVNTGNARSADVLALIAHVRKSVADRTGVLMECEVRYVAPAGGVVPAHEALF